MNAGYHCGVSVTFNGIVGQSCVTVSQLDTEVSLLYIDSLLLCVCVFSSDFTCSSSCLKFIIGFNSLYISVIKFI